MKVAAYIRVSTEGQAGEDRYGLQAQREAIQSHAKAQGLDIIQVYADEGISGAILDRPGLQQLLKEAGSGAFKKVLVYKMDRIARDLYSSLFVEKELLTSDIEIISVSEPVSGNDPMQTAFRQMMGVFAQLEKDMIAARLKGGRNEKARQGGYAGGGPAIGYKAEKGGKVLSLDSEKAGTVKRVFEIRRERPEWTLQRIADQLNKEGHSTAQGKQFKKMQVKRILDREGLYSGLYTYSGIEAEGQHIKII